MTLRQDSTARILDDHVPPKPRIVSRTEQEGIIDRQRFFLHLETWKRGGRVCKVTLMDESGKPSEVLDNAMVNGVNENKAEVSFVASDRKKKVHFGLDCEFRYFDYDDSDPQMQEYFAQDISAWMRVYRDQTPVASLLQYDD
jgi:hypothetical protein